MSGVLRWVRLSFRLQRWEVLAAVVGVAIGVAVAAWFILALRELAAGEPGCPDPAAYVAGCEAYARRFGETADLARHLTSLAWLAPFGFGLVLGVPLVAREVEHGTAGLAWTLSRSRLRWLVSRAAFAIIVLLLVLGAVAVASEVLAAAILPNVDLASDFTWYGRRGWLLVARGLAAFGLGLAVGAIVGRVLPALLAAAFVSVLVFGGLSLGMDRWNETLAVVIDPYATPGGVVEGSLGLGGGVELPSGEVVAYAQIESDTQFTDQTGAIYTRWDEASGQPDAASFVGWDRTRIIPGRQYPVVLARDAAVTLGLGALVIGGAGIAVLRRRPA